MKNLLKNKSGIALPIVLGIILIVSILATGLFTYSYNELGFLKQDIEHENTEYLARAGVEIAMKAFKHAPPEYTSDQSVNIQMDRVYLMESDEFKTEKDGINDSSPDVKGYVDVTLSHPEEDFGTGTVKVLQFESTAHIGDTSAVVKAISTPTGEGLNLGWYNNAGLVSIPAKTATSINVDGIFSSSTIAVKYNYFPGIVKINPPSTTETLPLKLPNSNTIIAWEAMSMFVEAPIDLRDTTDGIMKGLVVRGQNIVFKDEINLYCDQFGRRLGTVIIGVPNELYYEEGDSYDYGLVYFQSDVYLNVSRLFLSPIRYKIISKGSTYRFRKNTIDNMAGIDLVKWYTDVYGEDEAVSALVKLIKQILDNSYGTKKYRLNDMIPVTDYTEMAPPSPDNLATVVWR